MNKIQMTELREYQKRCCQSVWEALEQGEDALLQAPTGAGKSLIVAAITNRLVNVVPGGRVLILVDREILVTQLRDSLSKFYPNIQVGIVCAGASNSKDCTKQVTVASRQTLVNHFHEMPPVQLLIADEAHLLKPPRAEQQPDQYASIINRMTEYNPKMRIFGCSATPYRLANGFIYGKAHHPDDHPYFSGLTAKITFKELTEAGYLAPLVGEIQESNIDLSNVTTIAGEYNLGQLSDVMAQHVDTVAEAINNYAPDRKRIMVFCVDIAHAEKVAEMTGGFAFHSKLPKIARYAALQGFETGKIRVMCSVATLTTGFDNPKVDCIVMARPTKSPALHIQMIGRGLRTSEGKENCLLIDLTNNTKDHLPTNDLDNVFVNIPSGRGGDGEAPFKICPGIMPDGSQCLTELHPKLVFCPECGFHFEQLVAEVLPDLKSVLFNNLEPEPPEALYIREIQYLLYQSKKEKWMMKVVYDVGTDFMPRQVNEFIMFPDFYSGFPVTKSRDWWESRTTEPFPETAEEAEFLSGSLEEPTQILVERDGHWDRITQHIFDNDFDDEPDFTELPPLESTGEDIPF